MNLLESLRHALGDECVLDSLTARYAFANDAGPYHLIPEVVLQPKTELHVQKILQLAKVSRRPVVFRAGGTSLSGQSITDGWLVDIGRHWRLVEPRPEQSLVRVQPGAIGGLVNAHLHRYGQKIGPDPSSIMSAMIGGILSNNSSGMCCGVLHNAYHTLQSLRFILSDGTIWDTNRPGEKNRFETEAQLLCDGLANLRDQVRNSIGLAQRIRAKYRQKNTVGYSLNAFLDYDHPLDIFAHLLIGAEGTLAFISEAILRTIPELAFKSTGMAYFEDVQKACDAVPLLTEAQCEAIELMDTASLKSIQDLEGAPANLKSLLASFPSLMAVLFEFQAEDAEKLNEYTSTFQTVVQPTLQVVAPIELTGDKKQQAYLWKLRKGMYPAVAAVRARGEAAILEDIAVPVDKLGPMILDLQALFKKHAYANGIIFGHAKDGNLHFVITQSLNAAKDIDRYRLFIDDMVQMVVNKYDGALKAEHGTGRNMAPFVETEWGQEAVAIMRRLKSLADPECRLNPDVILASSPTLHLQNLKTLPVVEEVVDKCIECGACEPRCPSRDFTVSPRQRIVLRRAMARLIDSGDEVTAAKLDDEYNIAGIATCATDGLCAIDCPVAINTGDLVKQLRRGHTKSLDRGLARVAMRHFGTIERWTQKALWTAMGVNRLFGKDTASRISGVLAKFCGTIPQWRDGLGTEPLPMNYCFPNDADFIYLPACMSRMMGGTAEPLMAVSRRTGLRVYIPQASLGLCCGQAFSSKGYLDAAIQKQQEWIDRAYQLSNSGRQAIVTDLGSCTAFLKQSKLPLDDATRQKWDQLTVLDSIEYAQRFVMEKLDVRRKKKSIAVHSVCSNQKLGWDTDLIEVAEQCADRVVQPHLGGCCGMGGDRGFVFPGLSRAATAGVRHAMDEADCDDGYTTARSCAISLQSSSGYSWRSLFHLLDEVSR